MVIIYSRIHIYWNNIIKMMNYLSTEGQASKMSLSTAPLDGFSHSLLSLESIKFSRKSMEMDSHL